MAMINQCGPVEWAQESDWLWRMFRVPAAVLNRLTGYVASKEVHQNAENSEHDEVDVDHE